MSPELNSFKENKFTSIPSSDNQSNIFGDFFPASKNIGIGEGHSRLLQGSFLDDLQSYGSVAQPEVKQVNTGGMSLPYAGNIDFDCDSFWESSKPEQMEESHSSFFPSQVNVPHFQVGDNYRQVSRTTSSSTSISDEELEKIYESYKNRPIMGYMPLMEESTTMKSNEYATPKKKKGNANQEQWVDENRSRNQQQMHSKGKKQKDKFCRFCRSNGEMVEFYCSHKLKDDDGNITCPILRNYVCPNCFATGSKAHTKKHCPLYQPKTSSVRRKGCYTRRNAAGHLVLSRV